MGWVNTLQRYKKRGEGHNGGSHFMHIGLKHGNVTVRKYFTACYTFDKILQIHGEICEMTKYT